MSRYYGGWAPYVPVAERRRRAEKAMEKRRKAGQKVSPVTITGRAIATTFWGRAWCDNMESYHDYENRLPRGRTYVRNGSVVDLQIAPGRITAVVSGSELYDVTITIKETPKPQWKSICADCAGGIDSLVELLQGRFSQGVMERLCRQQGGLFPRPADIRFSCSCPDHASMCKHVAAVLYGVGARLDHQPDLLFRLRAVDEKDLVTHIDAAMPMSKQGPAAGRVLDAGDVSALFDLDMAAPEASTAGKPSGRPKKDRLPAVAVGKTAARPRAAGQKQAAASKTPARPVPQPAATAAKQTPVKPLAPKKPAATAKAIPRSSSARKPVTTAKVSSRAVAPKKAAVKTERQKPLRTGEPNGTRRQAKQTSVATPVALSAPASGRRKSPVSTEKTVKAHEPKQQPVKWW